MIASANAYELSAWAALAGGMTLSFLYSGLETGVYAVSKIRLDLRAEAGGGAPRRLKAALRDGREVLAVLLIGNNAANYLASAGMVGLLTSRRVGGADWVSAAILTPVIFVFCEVLPKNLFHRHSETLTYALSRFLAISRWTFKAIGLVGTVRAIVQAVLRLAGRRLGPHDSPLGGAQRIAAILAEGRASGVVTHDQSLIAERVVNIENVRLADVMVPIGRAVLADRHASPEDLRALMARHGHPRVAVYEGQPDHIVGALNIYDVLLDETGRPPAEHVTTPPALPQTLSVIEAMVALQRRREVLAFVTDADGGCVGLITTKDLLEEIVGELAES